MMIFALSVNSTNLIADAFVDSSTPSRYFKMKETYAKKASLVVWSCCHQVFIGLVLLCSSHSSFYVYANILITSSLVSTIVGLTLFGALIMVFYPCLADPEMENLYEEELMKGLPSNSITGTPTITPGIYQQRD